MRAATCARSRYGVVPYAATLCFAMLCYAHEGGGQGGRVVYAAREGPGGGEHHGLLLPWAVPWGVTQLVSVAVGKVAALMRKGVGGECGSRYLFPP